MTQSSEVKQDLKSQPAQSFSFFKDPGCFSSLGLNMHLPARRTERPAVETSTLLTELTRQW